MWIGGKNEENFFIPKNNFIRWKEAKSFFQKLIQSSFDFHLKTQFFKKLFKTFKKCFFDLKEYDPEEEFYGDDRDLLLENGTSVDPSNERIIEGRPKTQNNHQRKPKNKKHAKFSSEADSTSSIWRVSNGSGRRPKPKIS